MKRTLNNIESEKVGKWESGIIPSHSLTLSLSHFQYNFYTIILNLCKWFLWVIFLNIPFLSKAGTWQAVSQSNQYIDSKVQSVVFECPGNLILIPSDENGISYTVPPAEGDRVEYLVNGNTLSIRLKSDQDKRDDIYKNNNNLTVLVLVKLLENIVFSGSGKMEVKNFLGKSLHCVWNGSGDFTGSMDYEKITLLHKGSGKMELSGKTQELLLTHSGTGDIFAKKLRSINSIVTLSGTGDIFVSVTGELTANLIGTGNIYYYKNPKLKKSVTGWGTISKRMEALW